MKTINNYIHNKYSYSRNHIVLDIFRDTFFPKVTSGDTVVIRGQPMGGPPPEVTITLCNITAPKLERWKGNDRYVYNHDIEI